MNKPIHARTLLPALTLSLLLAACSGPATPGGEATQTQPQTGDTEATDAPKASPGTLPVTTRPDPRDLPADARLGAAIVAQGVTGGQALPGHAQTAVVALKVLILSSGDGDYGLDSATAMLQQSGVPYDVLDASREALTLSRLIASDGSGKYQGVILTDSALINEAAPGVYTSTLDSSEWETLFQYESAYKVRQLALYGYPGVEPEDYGLRAVDGAETSSTTMTPTDAGKAVFRDLTGRALPVAYSYSYPSRVQAVPGVTTQVLMKDPAGRALGVTSTAADGRERLLLTTAENPYLRHTQLMGYGLVQWLTKGVHLGEHRRFLQVDIDDYFLSGDHYNAATGQLYAKEFRVSAQDMQSVVAQQQGLRGSFALAQNFRYTLVFNAGGAKTAAAQQCTFPINKTGDALTSYTKCIKNDFFWVNHTQDHLRMDVMDLATATQQVAGNLTLAAQLGLPVNTRSLVTGEHSGLGFMDPGDDGTHNDDDFNPVKQDLGLGRSNPNMLRAADSAGVRYLASDHSVNSQWDAGCPTCGVQHPLNGNLFLVPRWPNDVHYWATTPAEAVASYNAIYAPGGTAPYWDHALNYAEFLDQGSDQTLDHILGGGAFPHFMHQTNLRQYASGKSLATDWVKAALSKYSTYSTLPLNTYPWDQLGDHMQSHTAEEQAKSAGTLRGTWNRVTGTVTLSNLSAGPVPVTLTGANEGTPYGAYVTQTLSLSGSRAVPVTPR